MMSKGIFVTRLIEAAKAAQELGANLTVEPDGIAVRSNGPAVTVEYEQIEHGDLVETVNRVTS